MRFRQRVWKRFTSDIRHLRHIDAYMLAAFLALFAVLTTFPELVPDRLEEAAILAALGLLVYNITVPEQQETDFDMLLNDRTNFPPFTETIKGATQLWIYAASAVNILTVDQMNPPQATPLEWQWLGGFLAGFSPCISLCNAV